MMTRRSPLAAAFLTALLALSTSPANADSQTDLVTQTGWAWLGNTTLQTVDNWVNQGYRIVDIEVENDDPLRLSAAFVRNSGDYQKSWWWYYDQTAVSTAILMNANNARLIDVEPYLTPNGIRYAVVMIENTGSDYALNHGWIRDYTANEVENWIFNNPTLRISDIQPYLVGGNRRYAFCWLSNSGQTQSPYWVSMNATMGQINSRLASNNARLIDLEPHDGIDRFSAVMAPLDGNAWSWFTELGFGDVGRLAGQYASRIIDIQRYENGSGVTRYATLLRRNDNDLAIETTQAMRESLTPGATSGFILREYQGTDSTLAGVFEDRVCDPTKMMMTVYHFVANLQVAYGLETFALPLTEWQGEDAGCPNWTMPVASSLGEILRRMMEIGTPTAAESIRDHYSSAFIEATAHAFGAENVQLNHMLGCACGMTPNEATMRDFADLHGAVIDGVLGAITDDFYSRMNNSVAFGNGGFLSDDILEDELAASSLSSSERAALESGVMFAHRGGAATCGGGTQSHRARGLYLRIPERSGCETVMREYFIGVWVNDGATSIDTARAVGAGITGLYRDRVRAAIETWENAACSPFDNYCTAEFNSSGQRGRIAATGTPYLLENNLVMRGSAMPAGSFASIIFGDSRVFTPNAGGSAGNLCVGGSIGRLFDSIGTTSANGTLTFGVDNGDLSTSSGGPFTLQPGDQLMFQWWFRDVGPTGPTSNFTNAVEVTFI